MSTRFILRQIISRARDRLLKRGGEYGIRYVRPYVSSCGAGSGKLKQCTGIMLPVFLIVCGEFSPAAAGEDTKHADAFISTWDTTKVRNDSSSDADQVKLPLVKDGNYDFTVNWGDENEDDITSYENDLTHTYAEKGEYTIKITGKIEGWSFGSSGDKLKIQNISQWGNLKWGNAGGYFHGTENLSITAEDQPDLSGTSTMECAFRESGISSVPAMNEWDVSNVENMARMFQDASSFNQNIGGWEVSKVEDMEEMFCRARSFNQSIGDWDVSNVNDMNRMFLGAESFNGDIGDWDVSSVVMMWGMFQGAESFNRDIGGWKVGNVRTMWGMFRDATSFNQDISAWDVSSVKYMAWMFENADSFNQDIGGWDVGDVSDMVGMFRGADSFNGDIGGWDVSSVKYMTSMFHRAESFDQDIGRWDVSNVEIMKNMFLKAKLSTENYDSLLTCWTKLDVQKEVKFHCGKSQYSQQAAEARQKLIDEYSWEITDGGKVQEK